MISVFFIKIVLGISTKLKLILRLYCNSFKVNQELEVVKAGKYFTFGQDHIPELMIMPGP